jgi:hypothetical protein
LKGDTQEKKGQIAHLDHRRSNALQDNLAWLCFDHHSEYDSTTSQHKNYTIGEVKEARRALYKWVEKGMPVPSPRAKSKPRSGKKRSSPNAVRSLPEKRFDKIRPATSQLPHPYHRTSSTRKIIRTTVEPILGYRGIHKLGHVTGGSYGPGVPQGVTIRNSQTAVKNMANNVKARIEYSHARDHFVVDPAIWYIVRGTPSNQTIRWDLQVSLSEAEEQSFLLLIGLDDGRYVVSDNGGIFKELEEGNWVAHISVKGDNGSSVERDIPFTFIRNKLFEYL